jgi:hypothetical protein
MLITPFILGDLGDFARNLFLGIELMNNRIVHFENGLDEWINTLTPAFHRTYIKPETPV